MARLPESLAGPRREEAANLLAQGYEDEDVAEALGVSRSTAWRWRRMPAVVEAAVRIEEQSARSLLDALTKAAPDSWSERRAKLVLKIERFLRRLT